MQLAEKKKRQRLLGRSQSHWVHIRKTNNRIGFDERRLCPCLSLELLRVGEAVKTSKKKLRHEISSRNCVPCLKKAATVGNPSEATGWLFPTLCTCGFREVRVGSLLDLTGKILFVSSMKYHLVHPLVLVRMTQLVDIGYLVQCYAETLVHRSCPQCYPCAKKKKKI